MADPRTRVESVNGLRWQPILHPGPPGIPIREFRDSRDNEFPLGIPGNFWIFEKFCREFTGIWWNRKF